MLRALLETYMRELGFHPTASDGSDDYGWGHPELGERRNFLDCVEWQMSREGEAKKRSDAIVPRPLPMDKEYRVTIDGLLYAGHGLKPQMTGSEIRNLATPPISEDYDLWLIDPGHGDKHVGDSNVVDISAYGQSGRGGCRFFTAPKVINAGSLAADEEGGET